MGFNRGDNECKILGTIPTHSQASVVLAVLTCCWQEWLRKGVIERCLKGFRHGALEESEALILPLKGAASPTQAHPHPGLFSVATTISNTARKKTA